MYITGSLGQLSVENMELLIESAKSYPSNEFGRFVDETGWQDWMDEFTTAKDGEFISVRECDAINAVLREAWQVTHE